MPIAFRASLSSLIMSCLLALAPLPVLAEVYKCKQDGQTIYSTSPCGDKTQRVQTDLSVVPTYQPPAPATSAGTSSGLLSHFGMDGKDIVTGLLLILIPLSFAVMFFMSRKSESKTR